MGTANDSSETLKKIVELEPEMVFSQCFNENDKFELVKKSQEQLQNRTPRFNLFTEGKEITEDEIFKTTALVNDKLNMLIPNMDMERVKDAIRDYHDYKYN